jgi:hypothetical protein
MIFDENLKDRNHDNEMLPSLGADGEFIINLMG